MNCSGILADASSDTVRLPLQPKQLLELFDWHGFAEQEALVDHAIRDP